MANCGRIASRSGLGGFSFIACPGFGHPVAVGSGEPVLIVARSEGPVTAPDSGQRGRIEADSGDFCDAVVEPVGGNQVTFSCELTFSTVGTRMITAHYAGSARYDPSQSGTAMIEVFSRVFADRFEAP